MPPTPSKRGFQGLNIPLVVKKSFYVSVYGQNEITGDSGQIVSPLFPSMAFLQPGQSTFTWVITVDQGATIYINFEVFEIEVNGYEDHGCLSELIILDGIDTSVPELFRDCGSQIPGAVVSTGSGVMVALHLGSYDAHVRL